MVDTANLFFVWPCGDYPAGTRVPAGFQPERIPEMLAQGAIIEVPVIAPGETPPEGVVVGKKAKKEKKPDLSKWRFTPEELKDLDLDGLNMFILEHATQYTLPVPDPFTDRDAAIAFLGSEL